MEIVSLYDGMSCGMISFKELGIDVDKYDAFEIDKYAVQTSKHNFPEIVHHGDVFEADFTQYEGADFVIGGSPCTYWSIAQKNNRETEASGLGWDLFCQYVRAIKEVKPKYFVYENNKSMSEAIRKSICEAFGFEQILINSSLVSAQNRQRYYWVGKRNPDGTYSKVNVEQPADRGILLKDVLDGVGSNELREIEIDYMVRTVKGGRNHFDFCHHQDATREKARCLTANVSKGVPYNCLVEPINITNSGKSQTIKAQYYKNNATNFCGYTSTYGAFGVAESVRIGCMPSPDGTIKNSQGMRVYSIDGKAVTQQAVSGGLGAKTGLYAVPICHDIQQEVTVRKYEVDCKALTKCLRNHKFTSNFTNKEIAEKLNIPVTKVEHWFRTDDCFAIPDAEIWLDLKKLLSIKTNEFDESIMTFETKDGVFEKSNRCYDIDGKMSTIMTDKTDNVIMPVRYATGVIEQPYKREKNSEGKYDRRYEARTDGKSYNLVSTHAGQFGLCAVAVEFDGDVPTKAKSGADGKIYTVYEVKDGQITIKDKQYPIKLADGYYIIRKLTVSECKRLQTVPEWFEFPVSDTQAYKQLGNGWTCEVIMHLIKSCLED